MVKRLINDILLNILPSRAYLKLLIFKRGYEEPELKLVYEFCDKDSISLDVGAANGMYLAHLYRISKFTYAFEPRKDALQRLKKMFSGITTSIQFEEVALSDISGSKKLRILKINDRLSTIEAENTIEEFGEVDEVNVVVKRIDDYSFNTKVSFIKIDVEGHEEAVIRGATNLLNKDQPVLLVEIEERHKRNSINNVKSFLKKLDYEGYFYLDKVLHRIELFDIQKHHSYHVKSQPYIFNFIYLHKNAISKFSYLISKA
ncbi:MAG: FkbM family methyltransferase [Flavobacterium sp.]|nr:FkbM family methyltransferase [Pedobacter sp.]